MKKIINYVFVFLISSITISCGDGLENPEVDFTVNNLNPKVGEKVKFTITGEAETFVIFTGDNKREFVNSHLALTSGINVDRELVVLNSDKLQDIRNYLLPRVTNYNNSANANNQIDLDAIMTNIATQVGVEYTNKYTAAYKIWEFMSVLQGNVAREIVDNFYEDKSTSLAPSGGFSTGFAIDRYLKSLEYTYSTPGTYVVTLIATNLSDKQYSGSGYQNDRTSSASEYNYGRTIREIIINVQP